MGNTTWFLLCLLTSAGVTYLVRMVPLVLAVMTIPAIFYATDSILSAAAGFLVAVVLSYFEKSLLTVAASACGAVLIAELILRALGML